MACSKLEPETLKTVELLNCSICLERFKTPRHLPCIHTFCEICLASYITSTTKTESSGQNGFPCPICRRHVSPESPGSPMDTWAKSFPVNHLINSMMELTNLENTTNKSDTKCHWCERMSKSEVAVVWCKDCKDALCDQCKSVHAVMRYFAHTFVPIGDVGQLESLLLEVEEPCPLHKGKVYEVYCSDHTMLCCSVCFATKHRKCEDVKSLDEIAEILDKTKAQEAVKCLLETEKKVKEVMEDYDQNATALETKGQGIISSVSTEVMKAKKYLETLEAEFTKTFETTINENVGKVQRCSEHYRRFLSCVETNRKLLEAVVEKGSPKQVFVTTEKIRGQLNAQFQNLKEELKSGDERIEVEFTIADEVQNIKVIKSLGVPEIRSTCNVHIGGIALKLQTFKVSICQSAIESDPLYVVDPFQLKPTEIRQFEAQREVYAGEYLSDDRLIFLHSSPSCLMVYSETGTVFKEYASPQNDIKDVKAAHAADEIFISAGKSVYRYKLDDQFTCLQTISSQTSTNISGLAVLEDMFVVGVEDNVNLMTGSGTVVKTFSSSFEGRVSNYVGVSKRKMKFYFKNTSKEITCCTSDGNVLWQNVPTDINTIRGMATDLQDNLYVCGYESKCLIQIRKDGSKSRVLVKFGEKPYVIGFHPDGIRFFVASIRNKKVHLYKLATTKA